MNTSQINKDMGIEWIYENQCFIMVKVQSEQEDTKQEDTKNMSQS